MHSWLIARTTPLLFRRRAAAVTLLAAAALVLGLAGASWHYSLPEPGFNAPAVRLYAGARPIGVVHPARRAQSWVRLDRIPRPVVDAVLTAEDLRFWSHPGFDLLAIGRALQINIKRFGLREGASTITGQVQARVGPAPRGLASRSRAVPSGAGRPSRTTCERQRARGARTR